MLVLVVDSSTPAVTAALADIAETAGDPAIAESPGGAADPISGTPGSAADAAGGVQLIAARRTVDARAHGELLAPQIREILAEVRVRPWELRAIVAGLGPGPFTGLRVGLVTAASMAQTLGIPAYGVCSLDALGWAAGTGIGTCNGANAVPGRLLVATDARRREIYWSVYEGGRPVTEPAVDVPARVLDELTRLGVTDAVGDGALRYADVLGGLPVRDEPRYPPAEALAALAARRIRQRAPGDLLTPLYLRRPDAVAPGARKAVLQR